MFDGLSPLSRLAIGLLLVLFLPRVVERFRFPAELGFILAGVVLGPGLTGVLQSNSPSIEIWSELGKLLFMFFAGFEIDLAEFNKVRNKAAVFGILTFLFPFLAGAVLGHVLGYGSAASVLIGSIIASHTLLARPNLARLRLQERESVLVAVGGSIFTDVTSMLVLAMTVSIYQSGFSRGFLLTEVVELSVYVPLVLFGLSKVARTFLAQFGNTPEARVCILLMLLTIAAELAQYIKLEGIVGSFLSGIAIKRAVRGKLTVEQLEVMAKTLFIPTFFLATGFLIDLELLFKTVTTRPQLAFGLITALAAGKWVGAWLTSRIYSYSALDAKLIFSVTLPQMAATLSSAVVGYNTKNASGQRLFDVEFVNAILVLVVVSCIAGPVLTDRWGKKLKEALADHHAADEDRILSGTSSSSTIPGA